MKKSTRHLIFLTASFVVIALVIPVALWILYHPKEVSEEEIVIEERTFRQEIPLVDQEINSIFIGKGLMIDSLTVRGVDSPKDQCVVALINEFDDSFHPVDISMKNKTLTITDPYDDPLSIESVIIYIANAPDTPLNLSYICYYFYDKDCCNASFENLCFSDLNMNYVYEECTFTNCKLPVVRIDQEETWSNINFRGSETDLLKIVSANNVNFSDDNSVRNLSVTANDDISLLISGYEGEIDLHRNGHHIYLDRE